MTALDRASIDALDSGHMLADILALPEHLGDAVWRVQTAAIEPLDTPGGLVIAGMGGSAIGGMLARAALGDQASRPILATRGYGLPPWTTPDTTVLCASYSGEPRRRSPASRPPARSARGGSRPPPAAASPRPRGPRTSR